MLTPQQHNVLSFIREYLQQQGHAPTLDEIGEAVGVRSRGSVHRLVQALVDKGQLRRDASGWRSLRLVEDDSTMPLLGRVAAGRPIEAIQGEETLDLSGMLLGPGRFALRVVGDSMIGAGILSGDTVVVKQAQTARDGEIVVALIDNDVATIKRLKRRKDGDIELIAENPTIAPMIYSPSRVLIQGVVVGQLRTYS
jgi:repressor LexA